MAAALQPVNGVLRLERPGRPARTVGMFVLAASPWLIAALVALPIAAGLLGTLLPAFGWLPALGGSGLGFEAWRDLLAAPGLRASLMLTLWTGVSSAVLSLVIALGLAAVLQGHGAVRRMGAAIAPLLAVPHSALAIGLAFVLLPSGWLVRSVSPGLTGWTVPPDVLTVGHPSGWPLVASLVIKEVPYLLLMTLAALNQVQAPAHVAAARALGHGPAAAWIKVVLPQVYPQLRLPVLAVLAFSLTVVDVALVLGPSDPPTLAALAVRWFADPDATRHFVAAAASIALFVVCGAAIGLWWLLERVVAQVGRRWIAGGGRFASAPGWCAAIAIAAALAYLAAALALVGLLLWSVAGPWRFPAAWPTGLTLDHWQRQSAALAGPLFNTIAVALLSTTIALVLVLAALEHGSRRRSGRAAALARQVLYLPLLVPQIAFVFGVQVLLVRLGADGTLAAVVGLHLVFVLPYVYLSLVDAWLALDPRWVRSAASLGASPARVFWAVKMPILLRPVGIAAAVGFTVSVGLYLPTVFAGAGRIATLTTEAVTLSSGADRRVIGTWAALQAALPWAAYLLALGVPRWIYANRRGLA